MHIEKCNNAILIDTYLSKKKISSDIQDMCKTLIHAFNLSSFKYKLCFFKKEHEVQNQ